MALIRLAYCGEMPTDGQDGEIDIGDG